MSETFFTDEQVTGACNLHIDNLRRLITWGAVTPVEAGGGRGRVRKWTARQALRVSATAQFVEAGFSLQMAHTITYCLPLDDLLYAYDPAMIRAHLKDKRFKSMISLRGKNYWPSKADYGSEVIIVDRRFLYSDVLGDAPTLLAVIDRERQRVVPMYSPYGFVFGVGMVEDFNLPRAVDAKKIVRSSLLMDDKFLLDDVLATRESMLKEIPSNLISQILSLDHLICKNFVSLNLAVGFTACVRNLLGLPVNYCPMEEEYDEC